MKLLTPTQNNDSKQSQTLRDILRTQEVQKASDKARKELANAEADFNTTLADNREKWALEEQEHEKRLLDMGTEIKALEIRKSKALAPIEIQKKEVEASFKELLEWKDKLTAKEVYLDELSEKLQDQLDSVGLKEQDIKKESERLEIQRLGAEQQKENIISGNKKLNQQLAEFIAVKQKDEQSITERKTSIALIESSLIAKDNLLKNRQKDLNDWHENIQLAIKTLEEKRKEELIPVEVLKKQAEKFKKESEIKLEESNNLNKEALQIKEKAQEDYNLLLKSLDARELYIKNEETRLERVSSEILSKQQLFVGDREKLDEDIKAYELNKKELEKEKQVLAWEKLEVIKLSEKVAQETNKNEVELLKIAEQSQALSVERKEMQGVFDIQKSLQLNKETELNVKLEGINALEASVNQHKENIDKSAQEMRKDLEAFADWRSKAETEIENKAMENSKKQKLLAEKEDKLKRQEKFLSDWSVRLKDERGTLDRAFEEVRKLRSNIPIEKPLDNT